MRILNALAATCITLSGCVHTAANGADKSPDARTKPHVLVVTGFADANKMENAGAIDAVRLPRQIRDTLGLSATLAPISSVGSATSRADALKAHISRQALCQGGKSLVLLAHSQGGVAAVKAVAASPKLRHCVRLFLTLGSPHKGTPEALKALKLWRTLRHAVTRKAPALAPKYEEGLQDLTKDYSAFSRSVHNDLGETRYINVAGLARPWRPFSGLRRKMQQQCSSYWDAKQGRVTQQAPKRLALPWSRAHAVSLRWLDGVREQLPARAQRHLSAPEELMEEAMKRAGQEARSRDLPIPHDDTVSVNSACPHENCICVGADHKQLVAGPEQAKHSPFDVVALLGYLLARTDT